MAGTIYILEEDRVLRQTRAGGGGGSLVHCAHRTYILVLFYYFYYIRIPYITILRAIRDDDVHIHHIYAGASSSVTGQTSRVMAAANGLR